ncbi:hypothetical protein M529_08905 [Sphingobium ummariense RL-3]|uniref:Uncharacterized protein n=1 Tax=Sphingobium ummariense RL-3 TaxID=1346791 RepID=T0K7A6_9SPHN|nr:hypothetical protein M529_08905 [Sphingobium ummariense RL-3]
MGFLEQIGRPCDRVRQNLVGISQLECGDSFALTSSINDAGNLTGSGDDRDTRIAGVGLLENALFLSLKVLFDLLW